jgi:predicted glycoside hydrolase/deacetylase ChbG (UPF0249 family)
MSQPRLLIINADDLGASPGINAGILEAIDARVVTSASLMVNMPAAASAAELAAARPWLSVGIHVNLTFERWDEPIVDFDNHSACETEIAAQFERFEGLMGRPPTHVDGQHNIQRDLRVLPILALAATQLGVPLREHGPVEYFPSFYGRWDGATHPEQISPETLLAMVDTFGRGPTELACHPGRPEPDFESDYHDERLIELETFLTEGLLLELEQKRIQLISYHEVPQVTP